MKEVILVVGSAGQIGIELVVKLRNIYGDRNVIASDIIIPSYDVMEGGPFELLDVLNKNQLKLVLAKHGITHIYMLAALLSATAEYHPESAWNLNINGLLNVLDLCKPYNISKLFWPSSIAVFGPSTPKIKTPQVTIMEPDTIYGISKLAGERWCEYYHKKEGVDCRSIRYPGLIGYRSNPGGGTTDYAVQIFHEAIRKNSYQCFLSKDTTLPMMYMEDALKATIGLMEADSSKLTVHSSYNVAGLSFSPDELTKEIEKHIPGFKCNYKPDLRQEIAKGWPESIDDSIAKRDWGWSPEYDLPGMTEDMLDNLITKQ